LDGAYGGEVESASRDTTGELKLVVGEVMRVVRIVCLFNVEGSMVLGISERVAIEGEVHGGGF